MSGAKNNSAEGNPRPTEFFMGCVTSLDGDLGTIDQETFFHISAVRGTETPKVGDNVVFKAETVRNMPGIKYNAKEVQVLRINIDPEKPNRILPVPPTPRISETPLHSNSERLSHTNLIHGESQTGPGEHSQVEEDIEEIKYSPENSNFPRKRKLDAEKSSADTREVKYSRMRSAREQSSKDLSMRRNLPSVPLPDIKIMPDEVHNASPVPEESSAPLSSPSVLNKTIPFNITLIKQEPAPEIMSTELEGDSPATNCLRNGPKSIWIDPSPSQLLFSETRTSGDEHIEIVDLTIDNNDEIPTPADFTQKWQLRISILNNDFDLKTASQVEDCTSVDSIQDSFHNNSDSSPNRNHLPFQLRPHPSGEPWIPSPQEFSVSDPSPRVNPRVNPFSNQIRPVLDNTRQECMRPPVSQNDFLQSPFMLDQWTRFVLNQTIPTFSPPRVPVVPDRLRRNPLAVADESGRKCRLCGRTGHNEPSCIYRGSES